MKKQLLASTMLVAAGALTASGAAEAKVDVSVNGYLEAIVGTSWQDEGNDPNKPEELGRGYQGSGADVDFDGEMHLNVRTELDNGIKMRGHIEYEFGAGGAGGSDPVDEEYLIVRGNFGQLTIGSEDNAAHLMTIGYLGLWATQVGQNLQFDVEDFMTTAGRALEPLWDARLVADDNDSEKITYYTPRMGGFQIGASYIPDFNQDDNDYPNADTSQHDGVAVGVNFDRKFGTVGLGIGAGYLHALGAENHEAPSSSETGAYSIAARADFGPVRVSGGYTNFTHMKDKRAEGQNFTAGARLSMGPNRFSLTYLWGEAVGFDTQDDEDATQQRMMVSYARTLGPGVAWTVNLMWNDFESDVEAANGQNQERTGTAVSTSIKMRF